MSHIFTMSLIETLVKTEMEHFRAEAIAFLVAAVASGGLAYVAVVAGAFTYRSADAGRPYMAGRYRSHYRMNDTFGYMQPRCMS